jgi:hypothetical protein
MVFSCQQQEVVDPDSGGNNLQAGTVDPKKDAFAVVLARALANPSVRQLLKNEAGKKFDNDTEVLFDMVRDKTLPDGQTFFDYLGDLHGSRAEFGALVDDQPLLTILVPELLHFNQAKWDVERQVPGVAVVPNTKTGAVPAYDYEGRRTLYKRHEFPKVPLLVVKNSERVVTDRNAMSKSRSRDAGAFHRGKNRGYYFFDDAFDNLTKPATDAGRTVPSVNSPLDPAVIAARNNHATYYRDYVYYGIVPPPTTGTFKNNYAEFITAFKVESVSSVNYIMDDTISDWTDGALEIYINIFFVDGKTSLTSLLKIFSCTVYDLFVINSNNVVTGTRTYTLPSPIQILPWDFNRFGNTWKFVISEDDNTGVTVQYQSSISSQFGSNVTNNVKDGPGFGSTSSTSYSQSITITMNGASDLLGEGVLSYMDPVIIGFSPGPPFPAYTTLDVTTGHVRLSVEPKKFF